MMWNPIAIKLKGAILFPLFPSSMFARSHFLEPLDVFAGGRLFGRKFSFLFRFDRTAVLDQLEGLVLGLLSVC